MNKSVFLAVIAFVGNVHSLYNPRTVDERHNHHENNFVGNDDSPKTQCPYGFTGRIAYANDQNCRQYLNCLNGYGSVQNCAPGTLFNARNSECDHPSKVKCNGIETNRNQYQRNQPYTGHSQRQETIRCEFGASGLYAHPFDCSKFLNCDNGRTFIQDCGPGTMFNDALKVCDWPHKVNCNSRNGNDEQQYSESQRHDVTYGEGQMDVRSNFNTEQIPSNQQHYASNQNHNRYGNPVENVRNQRRYPDEINQQSSNNNNHVYGVKIANNGGSLNHNQQSNSLHLSGLEPPLEQTAQSSIVVTNDRYPIDSNHLGAGYYGPSQHNKNNFNDRTGRFDQTFNGNGGASQRDHVITNTLDTKSNDPNDLQTQYPSVLLTSPRVINEFGSIFSNSRKEPTTTTTTTTTTTSKSVVVLDGEPVTQKVHAVYPSGFEELGARCDETKTDLSEHPYDCTKYVICENGRMRVHNCDAGFMFNPTLKICDFSKNVKNCNANTGIPITNPINEQDALNEIHDDDMEKTTKSYQSQYGHGQVTQSPYYIPDMSVIPLATYPPSSYERTTVRTDQSPYYGFKPSHGGDTNPDLFNEIIPRSDYERIEPTTNRGSKAYDFYETTTHKQSEHIMKIPSGKEHTIPIYHRNRPTTTTTTTTTTENPFAPLRSYNHISYQPFAQPPKEIEPEQDYIPISDALKLLLRPYIARNDTNTTTNTDKHMQNIENKLLDKFDEKNNVKIAQSKSLEQDGLASALLNENIAIKNLLIQQTTAPPTPQPQTRFDVESVPLNHIKHEYDSKPYHQSPPLLHSQFQHSSEFHKNHPHLNQNYNDYNSAATNQIIFPGPTNKHPNVHANQYNGGNNPSTNHNLLPPLQPSPVMYTSHNHPHTHHHKIESTTSITSSASAPTPSWQYQRPTTASRFGHNHNSSTPHCNGQFNCGNGKCTDLSRVCDGVNNCGNRRDELNCPHLNYQVRLSNYKGHKHMGRVEVRAYGRWGYVCDDQFTKTDADVLCRELGFNMGAAEVKPNSYYPVNPNLPGETAFMMDEVKCNGNETSLKECEFNGWGVSDCGTQEAVGVICKVTVMECPPGHLLCQTSEECIPVSFMCDSVRDCGDGTDESDMHCKSKIEYRLMDGNNDFEGRVEVKYHGIWGTVCDDDFGQEEANVFCKSIGFNGPASVINRRFGMTTGPIWLDQVSCLGNETSLDKCMHFSWSETNCKHNEDVNVRCSYGPDAKSSRLLADDNVLQHLTDIETPGRYQELQRSSKSLPIPDYSNQCGRIKVTDADDIDDNDAPGQFRVISGTRAKRGFHPWQATIRAIQNGRSDQAAHHLCGAIIISKNHILTAAHCVVGYASNAFVVRLGDHKSHIHENSEVQIFIEKMIHHEDFRKGHSMNNDIAIIQLKTPIQFTNFIQPICLPSREAAYEPGKNCTISGWGSIQYGKSTPSLDLKAASVPLISQEICRQKEIYGDDIKDTMFCAGFTDRSGVDACDGDSGGPLVCPNEDGVNELYGIISWGQRCGDSTKPGVYVKVVKYLDWIKEKMSQLI